MNYTITHEYLDLQEKYEKIYGRRTIVLMEVGSFFEIYGLIYPDGKRVGNIWEISDNLGLKISNKEQLIYNNPSIKI